MAEQYALVYAQGAAASLEPDQRFFAARDHREFVLAISKRWPSVVYIDVDLIPHLESDLKGLNVVGITDGTIDSAVRSLRAYPWLAHLASKRSNLTMVRERLERGLEHVLANEGVGRAALLNSSKRREARLERLREFFVSYQVPSRTVAAISDIAEELITNALYDAPVEAGYYRVPVSRTDDVELPPEHACEISYGIDRSHVFVRIRDPFGSLTRVRLVSVLDRCNRQNVSLDESRGGAGLGLWRVFSMPCAIAINVIPGRVTDFLAVVDIKGRATRHAHTVQLFFPQVHELDGALGRFAADHDHDLLDDSFTALTERF